MGSRQSSQCLQCAICRKRVRSGLQCNANNHLICSHCLSSYVTTYCESGHSLAVASGFVIRCPYKQCSSYLWRHSTLLQVEGSEILETYVDSLLYSAIITLNKPSVNYYFRVSLALKIIRAMTLMCPGCGIPMSKVRGACCSAECRQCDTHFCWLCFKVNSDRETCRTHVMMCHQNSLKVLYPPVYCVEAVHRLHKIKFVRMIIAEVKRDAQLINAGLKIEVDICGGMCTSNSTDNDTSQVEILIESVLKELQPILMDNGIVLKIK